MSYMKKIATFAIALLSVALLASPASASPRQTMTNEQLVTYVYDQLFNAHNTAVIDQYFSVNYIQHNPTIADGRAPLQKLIESLPAGSHNTIERVISEGDLVILQSDAEHGPGVSANVSDLFRVENGQIVEHWDVVQPIGPTASGNDLFSTLSQPQVSTPLPTASTEHSEQIVERYFTRLYTDHDLSAIDQYLASSLYQHDPALVNGAAAVKTAFEAQLAANPDEVVSSLKVIAEGDLVAVRYHYQANPTALGQAVVDIYRVSGNQIVEQWDGTQNVPATSANSNTMF
jgi:predicted SnoaL-like aldol condensation-catalyzing enzyme